MMVGLLSPDPVQDTYARWLHPAISVKLLLHMMLMLANPGANRRCVSVSLWWMQPIQWWLQLSIFHCALDMGFVHLGSAKQIQVWSNTVKGTHSFSSSNSNRVHVRLETQAPGEPDSKYVKLVFMLQRLATHEEHWRMLTW